MSSHCKSLNFLKLQAKSADELHKLKLSVLTIMPLLYLGIEIVSFAASAKRREW